jgi:hypothetical protein
LRRFRRFVVLFALLAWAPAARAEGVTELDAIGSIRAGVGWSTLYDTSVLSLSFEDQIRVHSLSRAVGATLVFGLDGQRPLDAGQRPGLLGTTIGAGLLVHDVRGPALALSFTGAPLLRGDDESLHLVGFGVGLRSELFPFYQPLSEAVRCERGVLATYVLSGLHVFVLGRRDWVGLGGESIAGGIGVDLGRNFVLPILGAALPAVCGKPPKVTVSR